ncbi:MAG: hypothetical protein F6K30_05755 [Cyanothece sp. SIO2G6]|nr:hypothetical protein [Cyanothece sp. SIO2G6]
MKYQLHDDPSSHATTDCLKQILTQVLGAIAFIGSLAMGLVTFQYLSQSPALESAPLVILFVLSLLGTAITLITVSLSVWLVMATAKFIQEQSHHRTSEAWRISHAHHI